MQNLETSSDLKLKLLSLGAHTHPMTARPFHVTLASWNCVTINNTENCLSGDIKTQQSLQHAHVIFLCETRIRETANYSLENLITHSEGQTSMASFQNASSAGGSLLMCKQT